MNPTATQTVKDAAAPTMHDHRQVLVVEDNRDIRETLELILASEGFDVTVASNGVDALAKLRDSPTLPSVIVLDLMMPVMDGYAFREAQQKDPHISCIPVVVLTADGHAERKAASLGAAGYLQKPVDLDALVAKVGCYC